MKRPRVARRAAALGAELVRISAGRSAVVPATSDRRFRDPAWSGNPVFRRLMQGYLATGSTLDALIDDAELTWRRDRITRLAVGTLHGALSPANFPLTNPVVIQQTIAQGGANLVKGARRAARDALARRLPVQVDAARFSVGGNLALTPGAVVHRQHAYELIEYTPATEHVHAVPLLVVPPTINKYYVLDLAPGRSHVEYLVARGFRVFIMSWRNPTAADAHLDLDAYAGAVLDARAEVASRTGSAAVSLQAVCSGGLIAAGALGHLAARDELREAIASFALVVSPVDTARGPDVSALATRDLAAAAVADSARTGYVDGNVLRTIFALMRPDELIWGYVVNNYLLGKEPPAFDILYWNDDAARLAAGLHRDFVRLALDNTFATPGATTVLGTRVDLGAVDVDLYALGGLNDHIVPWANAFRGSSLFGGSRRFVLSTSGHVQALINAPGPANRSSFRATDTPPEDPEALLRDVPTVSGSWWADYADWLAARSGAEVPAPAAPDPVPLGPAPGAYVRSP